MNAVECNVKSCQEGLVRIKSKSKKSESRWEKEGRKPEWGAGKGRGGCRMRIFSSLGISCLLFAATLAVQPTCQCADWSSSSRSLCFSFPNLASPNNSNTKRETKDRFVLCVSLICIKFRVVSSQKIIKISTKHIWVHFSSFVIVKVNLVSVDPFIGSSDTNNKSIPATTHRQQTTPAKTSNQGTKSSFWIPTRFLYLDPGHHQLWIYSDHFVVWLRSTKSA